MKKAERDFLGFFYRAVLVCGLGGSLIGLLFDGFWAAFSFAMGSLSIGFVLWMFDRVTAAIVRPRKARPRLESILFFLHFGLLGAFFYAMIRLFAVNLAWYAGGVSILLPALLGTALLFREEKEDDGPETEGEG